MKFTVADLLDQLSTEHSSEPDQLAKILKLSNKTDKAALELAVSSLMKIGVIMLVHISSIAFLGVHC